MGCMIHSYVIGRGNTATAYLQAGMIRPVPDATADAVVDVQVQRTGGESRLKDEEVVLFCLAEKRAERTCGEEKMATPGWTEKKRSSAPMRRGSVPQKIYWEGINLNKISKKIISLVTAAAFATTLVPAAVFAAPVEDSSVTVDNAALILNDKGTAETELTVDIGPTDAGKSFVLWFEDTDTPGVNGLAATTASISGDTANDDFVAGTSGWANAYYWRLAKAGVYNAKLTFTKPGTYDLYTTTNPADSGDQGYAANLANVKDAEKVLTITVSTTGAVVKDSRLLIDGKVGPASAEQGVTKEFSFAVREGNEVTDQPLAGYGEGVYVWVENSNGEIVKDATFSQADVKGLDVEPTSEEGIYVVKGEVNDTDTLDATFWTAGNGYTINAGVANNVPTVDGNKVVKSDVAGSYLNEVKNITVNVTAPETEIGYFTFTDVTGMDEDLVTDKNNDGTWNVRISDEVTPSDTKVYTVTGYAWVEKNVPAEEEEIAINADKGMNIVGDTTVKTDNTGKFTFQFTLEDAGQYEATVSAVDGSASASLIVTQGDVDAASIAVVKDSGMVLAGNDTKYAGQVYAGKTEVPLSDAVKLSITDVYGRDAVGYGPIADEWAANKGGKHDDAVRIISRGDGSELKAEDINLVWDENAGVYTIAYVGDNAAKDLTPGEYSVRVALRSGGNNAVTVNFTVAKFGTVQDIVLDMGAGEKYPWDNTANNNAITAIDDQVALGQYVYVAPKYVDENGLKVNIPNYNKLQVGINGDAVADRVISGSHIGFVTPKNTAANNDYVGSIITVKVNDPATNKYVEKELTVVKNYLNETVSIDPTQGVVGEANTVNVSVVDENGNVSKVNGKLSATIVSQSDEEATVDLKVNPDVRNGKASMYLESDKAGTVDVRVVVTANNGELYADTFTYTFGDEDPYAGTSVVMTIGSDQYLINNELFDGSVDNLGAPYVDSAWRTMVPARILAETFGGTVEFDEVDGVQTVSIVNGDTTIEMTVGSADYTINGEAAKAMDTEPVIVDGRTYVPVRFVAEGLGLDVTPLYDAETGTTASVVFQK